MEITIEDEVDGGVIIDSSLALGTQIIANYGISTTMWVHRFAESAETDSMLKVDLSGYSDLSIVSAHFGLYGIGQGGDDFTMALNKIIAGPWIEGTKNGTLASTGEPCFLWREYNTVPWNVAGCRGSGTDYEATPESTLLVNSAGAKTFSVTPATVEDWIDNPSTNYGGILRPTETVLSAYIYYASSENTAEDKPFFYMEYTEGGPSVLISKSRLINNGGNLGGLTKSTLNNLGGV